MQFFSSLVDLALLNEDNQKSKTKFWLFIGYSMFDTVTRIAFTLVLQLSVMLYLLAIIPIDNLTDL